VQSLRATRIGWHVPAATGILHAITRERNAGDDIACNTDSAGGSAPERRSPVADAVPRQPGTEDLSPATLRGYRYDLGHFLRWHQGLQGAPFKPEQLAGYDLIAYRQQMIAAGRSPATINRRLEALRRLGRWAHSSGMLAVDVVHDVRPVRTVRNRQPAGLTDSEVHAMLRAAGASGHGLAARNYALVQLMLQTGIRIGELAMLRVCDVTVNDRSGSLRIRQGKGLKAREVPLNATARRAIRAYLDTRSSVTKAKPLFISNRESAMPVRSIQAVIASVARRARIKRVAISVQYAATYLRARLFARPSWQAGRIGHAPWSRITRYHGRLHAAVGGRPRGGSRALASQCRRIKICCTPLGPDVAGHHHPIRAKMSLRVTGR
jgi:site-specific recombinase XerD